MKEMSRSRSPQSHSLTRAVFCGIHIGTERENCDNYKDQVSKRGGMKMSYVSVPLDKRLTPALALFAGMILLASALWA